MFHPGEEIDAHEFYNARMEAEHNPQNCLPDLIQPPETFEDYKSLSLLLYRAWNHANQVGHWARFASPSIAPTYGELRAMAEQISGMHAIYGLIARRVMSDQGQLFEVVTTLTPSGHRQAARQIERQCRTAPRCWLGLILSQETALLENPLSPVDAQLVEAYEHWRESTWHVEDSSSVWDQLHAERCRIEAYFKGVEQRTSSRRVRTQGFKTGQTQDKRNEKENRLPRDPVHIRLLGHLKKHASSIASRKRTRVDVIQAFVTENDLDENDYTFESLEKIAKRYQQHWKQ